MMLPRTQCCYWTFISLKMCSLRLVSQDSLISATKLQNTETRLFFFSFVFPFIFFESLKDAVVSRLRLKVNCINRKVKEGLCVNPGNADEISSCEAKGLNTSEAAVKLPFCSSGVFLHTLVQLFCSHRVCFSRWPSLHS